jgi:hypothetical protein
MVTHCWPRIWNKHSLCQTRNECLIILWNSHSLCQTRDECSIIWWWSANVFTGCSYCHAQDNCETASQIAKPGMTVRSYDDDRWVLHRMQFSVMPRTRMNMKSIYARGGRLLMHFIRVIIRVGSCKFIVKFAMRCWWRTHLAQTISSVSSNGIALNTHSSDNPFDELHR